MAEQFTKDMTISEILKKEPKTADVFMKHGMQCLGCPASAGETVTQAAQGHGTDVEKLLKDLNELNTD